MENKEGRLSRKPLRKSSPEATVSEKRLDLSADGVLAQDQRDARDVALNSLANQRRVVLDNTMRI